MEWRRCEPGGASDPPPAARIGHVAVVVDARAIWGTELLVVHGGIGEDKHALRDVAVMEAGDAHWLRPAPASGSGPAARAFHAAAAIDRTLYVHGGHVYVKEKKGLHKFDDLWALDTDTWEWSLVDLGGGGVRPSARDFAKLAALPGGRLLLFGGLDASEKRLDDAWIFDSATRTWSEVRAGGTRPKPRYGHGLALLGGPLVGTSAAAADPRALLFAGETASGAVADVHVLRGLAAPATSGGGSDEANSSQPSWTPLEISGTAPAPRKGHAIAAISRGIVVACGHTATVGWLRSRTDTFHSDVHLLEAVPPAAAAASGSASGLRWVQLSAGAGAEPAAGKLAGPAPREYHTLTALADGRLLLFGGGNGKEMYGDAWWLVLPGAEAASIPPPVQQPVQQPQRPPQQQIQQQAAASAAGPLIDMPGSPVAPATASAATSPRPPPQPQQSTPQQQAAQRPSPPKSAAAAAAGPAWWESIASTARSWTPGGGGGGIGGGSGQQPGGAASAVAAAGATTAGLSMTGGSSLMDQDAGTPLADMDSGTAAAVAAAAAAAELETLRESLGLPAVPAPPPQPPLPAEKDPALLELGSRVMAAAQGNAGQPKPYAPKPPAAARVAAARAALSTADVEALCLADLPTLLADLRRLILASPPPAISAVAASTRPNGTTASTASTSGNAAGRFVNLAARDIRLGELPQLLACYRELLQTIPVV